MFFSLDEKQLNQIAQALSDKNDANVVIKFIDQLNWNFFVGESNYSAAQKKEIVNSREYHLIAKYLPGFKRYVDSFLQVEQSSHKLKLKW